MTVPGEKATANYVPAAAVIRRLQALSGFTGCKGRVGGDYAEFAFVWEDNGKTVKSADVTILEAVGSDNYGLNP